MMQSAQQHRMLFAMTANSRVIDVFHHLFFFPEILLDARHQRRIVRRKIRVRCFLQLAQLFHQRQMRSIHGRHTERHFR
ncbi:hypothetical protein D9M68_955540 [compost metagenome]